MTERALAQPLHDASANVLAVVARLRSDLRALDDSRRSSARSLHALDSFRHRELKSQTERWMLRRRKVMKKSLGEKTRTHFRELFDALDSDGGGEVEFEEFAAAWALVRGRASSAREARELFAGIDVDRSGTMDFDEFARLMSDLEGARRDGGGAGDDRGAAFRQAASAMQTRRCVNDFITHWGGAGARAPRPD